MLRWFERHNKISSGVAILTAIFIFYMSSRVFEISSEAVASWLSVVYHVSVFAFFNFFFLIAAMKGEKKYPVFLLVILMSVIYGFLDELHQFFVPGRTSTIVDAGYDSTGILISSVFYFIMLNLNPRNS
jgi:hypothetical protein